MKELLQDFPEGVAADWQCDAVKEDGHADLRNVRVLSIAHLPQAVEKGRESISCTALVLACSLFDQQVLLAPDEESAMISRCPCKRIAMQNQGVEACHD
jgi:hypothetical protein